MLNLKCIDIYIYINTIAMNPLRIQMVALKTSATGRNGRLLVQQLITPESK